MEEIGTCIATKLTECLWDPISQVARYLFCFKEVVIIVEKAKDELEVKLADVNKRKEEADRKTKEIMPSVKRWLDDVNVVLEEVQKLQQELEGGGKKCFNVSFRYSLAKRMEDKVKRMMEIKQNSNFEPFSQLIQLPGITYLSSKEFVDFNSRKSTYNHLLEAITDGKNETIGLYGMAGSGKTTLAKEVGKRMEERKLFDKVVMAVISKTPNVFNIQQEIAEQIDLEIKETTQFTRAQRLYSGLEKKKILIILDDVWSKLRLEDIGIPLNEGCCLLLTTRLRDVCVSMDCKNIIKLSLLKDEEAWALFKMHANITNVSLNDFDKIGRKIVDECKGLPIAIVTVGSALRGKGFAEWKSALERLQHSLPLDIDEGSRGPYACLKLSYDYLPSPLAQSLFLLCSIFPEDHEIHIEDLLRFSKGALKFEEISYSIEGARSEIIASTNMLLDSCLLMHTDREECVKMHDLVRNLALWITKKQHRAILVDSQAVSRMMVENESLEKMEVISLWNLEDNFRLSNQLRCPTLELLLLHPKGFIEDIGGIEALRVLALVRFSFRWLSSWYDRIKWSPQSTVSRNLHTICFRGIELGDISFLCQLKRLEILDLRRSKFNELPAGLEHMNGLKLLDVFGCEIEKSPLGVIEKCEQLEELYVWDKKSAIQENFSLSRLKRYVIYDSTCSFDLYEEAPFRQYFDDEGIKEIRALCIQGFKVSALNSSMKDLIFRANYLWLEYCLWDYKDISFEIKHLVVSHCLERTIVDASFLQTGQVLPHLISLRLIKMDSLEQVFSHATLACHCPPLKELKIQDCPKLDRLVDEEATQGDPLLDDAKDNPHGNGTMSSFVVVTADSFDHLRNQKLLTLLLSLKDVRIVCSGRRMKGMFEVEVMRGTLLESEEYSGEQVEPLKLLNSELCILTLIDLPVLEYIWKGPTQSVSLYRLEHVKLLGCPKLQNVFSLAIVTSLPELRSLRVSGCEELEGVFCEESLKNLSPSNVCLPKLQDIDIGGCNKVKSLFPYSLASHCPSLYRLEIGRCFELERLFDETAANRDGLPLLKLNRLDLYNLPKLRDIFGEGLECPQQKNQNERGRLVNLELCRISLEELPVLECIWKGPTQTVSLQGLEYVVLRRCPKVKNIFTITIVKSLPKLTKLDVFECKEWEGIFCKESLVNLSSLSSSSFNVCFPKLKNILIRGCNKVKWLFSYSLASHCPSLEEIKIENCCEIEGVVEGCEGEVGNQEKLFPSLEYLTLKNLPKLRNIYKDYESNLQSGIIRIQDCPSIQNIPLLENKASSDLEIKSEN